MPDPRRSDRWSGPVRLVPALVASLVGVAACEREASAPAPAPAVSGGGAAPSGVEHALPAAGGSGRSGEPLTVQALAEEEVSIARKLVEDYPEDARAIGILGNVSSGHGDHSRAVEHWRRALEIDPKDADGWNVIAGVELQREEYAAAIRDWRRVLRLAPGYPGIHHRIGQALLLSGDVEGAIVELEADLGSPGGPARSHFLLGQCRSQRGEVDEALHHFGEAIRLEPRNVKALYAHATTLARAGKREEAREAMARFREAKQDDVARDKGDRSSYDDLSERRQRAAVTIQAAGRVRHAHGQGERAEALWRRALELDPDCVPALAALARHCRRSGRIEEALRLCGELSRREPRNPVHAMNSGFLLVELKRLEEAEAAFRAVCRLAPGEATGPRELARVLLERQGDVREAVALARRAVSLRPDAPHWYLLSRTLVRAGDREGSRRALEKAIGLAPEKTLYRKALEALDGNEDR